MLFPSNLPIMLGEASLNGSRRITKEGVYVIHRDTLSITRLPSGVLAIDAGGQQIVSHKWASRLR